MTLRLPSICAWAIAMTAVSAAFANPADEPPPAPAEPATNDASRSPNADPPTAPTARPLARAPITMMMIPRLRAISLNLEIEGAVRLAKSDGIDASPLMGRLELGLLVIREPWMFSVSATADLGGLASRGFGGQIEVSHLWGGLWGHLGVAWKRDDVVDDTAVLSLGAGWALIGLEWQRQMDSSDSLGDALYLQLRIPLGILYAVKYIQPTVTPHR